MTHTPVITDRLAADFEAALIGVLGAVDTYTTSEPWETCLACGCLCKPTETCPACRNQRLTRGTAA